MRPEPRHVERQRPRKPRDGAALPAGPSLLQHFNVEIYDGEARRSTVKNRFPAVAGAIEAPVVTLQTPQAAAGQFLQQGR